MLGWIQTITPAMSIAVIYGLVTVNRNEPIMNVPPVATTVSSNFSAIRILLATGMLVSFSGCSALSYWAENDYRVGPNYCQPAASAEIQWIDLEQDPRVSAEEPDITEWWKVLNDPILDELVQSAYRQNLTLRQAGTRIEQADAILGVAEGNLYPQFQQAVGGFQRIRTSRHVAVPSPVRRFDQHNLGLNAAWELDFWGRFRRSVDAADAALGASIHNYNDVAVILISNVAATYVQIRALQAQIDVARRNAESQRGSLNIADARFRAMQTNKLDLNQAVNNVKITEAAIPALEAQLRIANNQLCVLMGIPPRDIVSAWADAPIPQVNPNVQVGIPADLLRRRPDIQRSERLMKIQSEQIGITEAELYPHISLLGSFEWQAQNMSDLFQAESVFGLVGPSFGWNILNYGRIHNSIANEQAKFRETVVQYQQTVLLAQKEVEDAIIGFTKAQETSTALAEAVLEIDEAGEILGTLYQTGAIDFNRVYVIQSIQVQQQEQLVLSRTNEVLQLIKLYRALGGGWKIDPYRR